MFLFWILNAISDILDVLNTLQHAFLPPCFPHIQSPPNHVHVNISQAKIREWKSKWIITTGPFVILLRVILVDLGWFVLRIRPYRKQKSITTVMSFTSFNRQPDFHPLFAKGQHLNSCPIFTTVWPVSAVAVKSSRHCTIFCPLEYGKHFLQQHSL